MCFKCARTYGEQKPKGMDNYALGCGHWQVTGTRRWKGTHCWQGQCRKCPKRPRLHPMKVWVYDTKEEAQAQADLKNAEAAGRDA